MDSAIHVLQLACLSETAPARLRSLLQSCRNLLALEDEDLHLSVAVIRGRSACDDGLAERAAAKGVDYHEIVRRGRLDATVWWRLARLIRRLRVDIVHAHDARTHMLALLAQPWCGFRLVATAQPEDPRDWKHRLSLEVDRKLLPGFDRVIAANNQLARQLCQLGCRRSQVDVIQSGVDTEQFHRAAVSHDLRGELRIPRDALVLGTWIDELTEDDLKLLAAMRRHVEQQFGPLHLIIMGDEPPGDAMPAEGSLFDGPRTHALIGHENWPAVYAALDAFVLVGDNRRNVTPLLEAQSTEVPVACEHFPSVEEWIDQGTTGLVAEPRNTESLAEAVARLLADRRAAQSIASAGRLRICQRHRAIDRLRQIASTYRRVMAQAD